MDIKNLLLSLGRVGNTGFTEFEQCGFQLFRAYKRQNVRFSTGNSINYKQSCAICLAILDLENRLN